MPLSPRSGAKRTTTPFAPAFSGHFASQKIAIQADLGWRITDELTRSLAQGPDFPRRGRMMAHLNFRGATTPGGTIRHDASAPANA